MNWIFQNFRKQCGWRNEILKFTIKLSCKRFCSAKRQSAEVKVENDAAKDHANTSGLEVIIQILSKIFPWKGRLLHVPHTRLYFQEKAHECTIFYFLSATSGINDAFFICSWRVTGARQLQLAIIDCAASWSCIQGALFSAIERITTGQ